ncbi:hypothetical protein [Pseudoalteromonas peptidolytica]|uniref:Uncharacterized protein n=1 Tax=Pseudoalteromonas peptidolytica F12-50-A1 TaxID=1315280 RepID=A0A8I0T4M6_9GAMM|nr:hypothetical protein [Pseudoalteromonas peptidolytica]MBE0347145.1 hypothetical protein [Pseudoalteromonas peptidolytica F12-50-A1]NLR15935.1 hypothetical protein [Pseudoalteromonas peptidolytica]GEK11521.1 hypothetical protein PPE03_37700 [Pseudoalteromonas peptidolytica]
MRFSIKNTPSQPTRSTPLTQNLIEQVSGGTLGGKTKDPRGEKGSSARTMIYWPLPVGNQ